MLICNERRHVESITLLFYKKWSFLSKWSTNKTSLQEKMWCDVIAKV